MVILLYGNKRFVELSRLYFNLSLCTLLTTKLVINFACSLYSIVGIFRDRKLLGTLNGRADIMHSLLRILYKNLVSPDTRKHQGWATYQITRTWKRCPQTQVETTWGIYLDPLTASSAHAGSAFIAYPRL